MLPVQPAEMTTHTQPRRISASLAVLMLVAGGVASASPVQVQGVRLWAGPDNTRVVLDLDAATRHRLFVLHDPERVVVDVSEANWARGGDSTPAVDGVVRSIRHGKRPNGDLRIVLDVGEAVRPNSFAALPNEVYGHRLVIDLSRERPVQAVRAAPVDAARDIVVAIDAGHGGEDPGASGPGGTREKDVVLGIARALAKLVDSEPGMRPLLVRDGDYYVSLRDRMDRARAQRADIFLSIHADAFRDPRARGASVYALSARGATSEAARWLAERENTADLVGGVSLDDKDDVLASVLLDLSQTATISASMQAGNHVLRELGTVAHIRKRTVQQAGFIVLKSPDIPSILIETAYISNPSEERTLADPAAQRRFASAILAGVRGYFYDVALPGTLVARLAEERGQGRTYVINRGDTLSGIASRFNVSIPRLRAENGLHGDRIRIGQVLKIPLGAGTLASAGGN
jgi:N-acetylmuramoyl-L-alanine amidase